MKPEEAIEILSNELRIITDIISYCRNFEECNDMALAYQIKRQKAMEAAISALKEIQQYREIGSVEECQEAVEKQKPKKVKIKAWSPARCPSCDYELSTNVGDGYYKHPIFLERCPQCGQKLDWSEEE